MLLILRAFRFSWLRLDFQDPRVWIFFGGLQTSRDRTLLDRAVKSDKPLPPFMPVSEEWDTTTTAQSKGDRFIYLKTSNPLSSKPSLLNTLVTPEPIDANFLRTFDCGCA
jgi:hypothetical protein